MVVVMTNSIYLFFMLLQLCLMRPNTGCQSPFHEIGKISRLSSQCLLHAMGDTRIAAVQHFGEQISKQRNIFLRNMRGYQMFFVLIDGNMLEADDPVGSSCNFMHRIPAGKQTRTPHLV